MNTVRGPVAVRWETKDGTFTLDVTVPPNTRASVQLPVASAAGVTESGCPIVAGEVGSRADVTSLGMVDDRPAFEIGAGVYHFEIPLAEGR
jgi:alpha-L-rhamnosidase